MQAILYLPNKFYITNEYIFIYKGFSTIIEVFS